MTKIDLLAAQVREIPLKSQSLFFFVLDLQKLGFAHLNLNYYIHVKIKRRFQSPFAFIPTLLTDEPTKNPPTASNNYTKNPF